MRPLNNKERTHSEYETIKILDGKVVVLLDPNQDMDDVYLQSKIGLKEE